MPTTSSEGFRRVCAEHKYAHVGPMNLGEIYSRTLPCQLVPLPETSYRETWAFIISKNFSYQGLINWRWDNTMKSIRYVTDKSRLLWVPCKMSKTEKNMFVCYLNTRDLTRGKCGRFVPFLKLLMCCWISLLIRNWLIRVIGNLWIGKISVNTLNIKN